MRTDQTPPAVNFADPALVADAVHVMTHSGFGRVMAKYRPWRKVRHVAEENGLDATATWAAVKLARLSHRHRVPLRAMEGGEFSFCTFPSLIEQLHRIDHAVGGGVAALDAPHGALADPALRNRFAIRTLMDEAIESSLIEGAATTRADAIEMLRSGRPPRSRSEAMVVNNYAAMQRIKALLRKELSPTMLCDLQGVLTTDTLENPEQAGRFRRPDETVRVVDVRSNEPIFTPPPAESIPARIKALCDFANRSHDGERFIHPVVKASILHFMIGYEHPFVDGNGRTARAVFYWAALRAGYRVFEYLAISALIHKAIAKYPQAYIDTEQDEGDLTYFIQYKLSVIGRAVERLHECLMREAEEVDRSVRLVGLDRNLNLRQRLLLEHALRHPKTDYTVTSHSNSNRITRTTARADLDHLVKRKLMNTYKVGKEVHYKIAPGVAEKLARLEARAAETGVEDE
ncbi:MAG: Fic family protein [Phycisphaerales bacterium]|nr:Fic family protein [Phycisphaerales bacterium]